MKNKLMLIAALLFAFSICSCNNSKNTTPASKDTTMTDKKGSVESIEKKPVNLFDGKSLAGWHGFNKTGEIKNWEIEAILSRIMIMKILS
jgi:PBP1b-binding outer membrane lipoprotein LpoB